MTKRETFQEESYRLFQERRTAPNTDRIDARLEILHKAMLAEQQIPKLDALIESAQQKRAAAVADIDAARSRKAPRQ